MRRVLSYAMVATIALAGGTAYAKAPTNAGCGKDIEKNVGKLTAAVIKVAGKAAADYDKLIQKEGSSPSEASLTKLAEKTQKGWTKILADDGKSASAKALIALQSLVPKEKCNAPTLAANGHVPEEVASDFWARLAVTKAVQDGMDATSQRQATLYGALAALGATGSCEGCVTAFGGWCKTVPSNWGGVMSPPSGSVSEIYGALDLTVANTLAVALADQITNNKFCKSDWLGDNILGVSSGGKSQFAPIDVGGIAAACVTSVQATGWINCNSSGDQPAVDFDICQNHDKALGGDCSSGATFCFPDTEQDPDSVPGSGDEYTASGACYTINTSPPSAGNAFIASSTQISTIIGPAPGADGIACGPEEYAAATNNPPGSTWTTTGSGTITVLNTNIPVSSACRVGDDCVVNFGPGIGYKWSDDGGTTQTSTDICTALWANNNGTYGAIDYAITSQLGGGFSSINSLLDVDTINGLTVVSEVAPTP